MWKLVSIPAPPEWFIIELLLAAGGLISIYIVHEIRKGKKDLTPVCPKCNKRYPRPLVLSMIDPASKEGYTREYCPHCSSELSWRFTKLEGKSFKEFTGRKR